MTCHDMVNSTWNGAILRERREKLQSMKFIIITGMGRSGTTFIANLLGRARGIEARHEFFGGPTTLNAHSTRDTFRTVSYYRPNHPFLELVLRQQKQQIEAEYPNLHTFVDVNPFLPHALDAVRATFNDVLCFQLVRNGRNVVRSQFGGTKYSRTYHGTPILPLDPSTLELWGSYTRFERLCWWWNETVSRLLDRRVRSIHLERIVSDYGYLREQLLEPGGIDLDENVWRAMKDKKLHASHFRLRLFLSTNCE